ncbi:MAG: Na+/H+ antiporter NhaC [[Lactobacillus] timonensis]|jgi:NhaC family Na+:H+ antiporter|uniref:Na+/H+ antiporter NhaC n=1 Tax=[Lactobacillus] timonensis TaxID=1970790 RepID=UPI000C83B36A|nr:Na+/H+ antiporter NhaC [[Lactobacillus] timonensis]MCI1926264.1 Na+/H+ antiporter NhaC [[Lactobacillus] timonensis]MCI1957646.1 Na+/H+ antiporter NhaC [[Lactobacillus] timonensis]MCI1970664.1 Na+/H+ antiporter NhaC [[Lactobacillus] timonensis]MCI2006810.1 Na+/H+ antiporter NhaC [[Lactobacillus] timonensis]
MKKIGFTEAIIVLLLMLIILGTSVIHLGLSPQIPVLFTVGLIVFWAKIRGASWDDIHDGIKEGIGTAIIPIFIFLLIGALIAVWIKAGIIPSIMVLGFKLISGSFFVPSVFIVCSLIGVSIGSGFTTISTIGIALLGMGITMHVNDALIAGAILSGAIFGDKMSPLSDSTNLASAVAGSDLFKHIKNMMWTTIPAWIISLILFWILGGHHESLAANHVAKTVAVLNHSFTISWWAALPIILMFACAWLKIPAIPTLFINIFTAVIMIFCSQPHYSLKALVNLITDGFVAHTSDQSVNALLSRGGISSMMGTVSLIVMTLSLGGVLMKFHVIQTALNPLIKHLMNPGRLITATILSGIGVNVFIGEQYLSVILPGRAFKEPFFKLGLDPLALSRVLEDGGSVINYLIPWGVAGSFAAATLNVPVLHFLPFTFFSLLSPLFSIASGWTGIGLKWAQHSNK